MTEPTKICKTCGEDKPLSEYHKHSSTRDKRRSECKVCAIDRVKKWKRENPDKVQANAEAHRDQRREASRRWRENNPDKVAQQKVRAKERRRKRPEGGNGNTPN